MYWLSTFAVLSALFVFSDCNVLKRNRRSIIPEGIRTSHFSFNNGSPEYRLFKVLYSDENFAKDVKEQILTYTGETELVNVQESQLQGFRMDYKKYGDYGKSIQDYKNFVRDSFDKIEKLPLEKQEGLRQYIKSCVKYRKESAETKQDDIHRELSDQWEREGNNFDEKYDELIAEKKENEEKMWRKIDNGEQSEEETPQQKAEEGTPEVKVAEETPKKLTKGQKRAAQRRRQAQAERDKQNTGNTGNTENTDQIADVEDGNEIVEIEKIETDSIKEGWGDWFSKHFNTAKKWVKQRLGYGETTDEIETELKNVKGVQEQRKKEQIEEEQQEAEKRKEKQQQEEEQKRKKAAAAAAAAEAESEAEADEELAVVEEYDMFLDEEE